MVKNGIERQTSTAKVLKINYSKGREHCQCVKKGGFLDEFVFIFDWK